MNSRNYDHVPPLVSNTVTVATSSTAQVRLQPGAGQLRSMPTVPMRQPVPIRKIVHDSGGVGGVPTTSSGIPPVQYPLVQHQVKEELDTMDYPGASTSSSGPLIGPSSSSANSFQQYQRGSTGPQSSSAANVASGALVMNNGSANPGNNMAMDQPAPVNLASKVAEVFLTAGHAFQKLGDLTLQLHTTADADESKWSEKEVDNLKVALTRFAHELDQISTCVASRTTKHIKNDIKRRHLVADDPPQPTKRLAMNASGPSGTYTTVNSVGMMSGHTVPLGQKRMGGQPMGKLMTARAVIPTARYAVAPLSGGGNSSGMMPSSTVVVNSSQSPSPVGMPQLQSQSGPSSSSGGSSSQQPQRIVTTSATPTTITRVMAPQQMLQGGLKSNVGGGMPLKRMMTPTSSGPMSMPSSGALILEHGDHQN